MRVSHRPNLTCGVIPAQAGIHSHRPIVYSKNLEVSGIWIPAGVYPGFGAGMTRVIFLLLFTILLSAFTQQPMDEKKAQGLLPQSHHPFWETLAKCKISYNEKKGVFIRNFTPEVKALDGKEVTINGFMLPLEDSRKQKVFYLSRKTPTCPFCMPGGPTEVVYVKTKTSIEFSYDPLTIKGTFRLVDNEEKGVFFQLEDAVIGK